MIDTAGIRLFLFDADGTLRRCTVPGQPCPNKDGEWELIPGVRDRLSGLADRTSANPTRAGIVSNQGGVGLGMIRPNAAFDMLWQIGLQVFGYDFELWQIYMCPHAPKAGCACRKPNPGLLYKAMIDADTGPHETLFVGDQDTDRLAAERAGVRFAWAWQFFGWSEPPEFAY